METAQTTNDRFVLRKHDGGVVNITSEQLREYAASHADDEYTLIDVREREEYRDGHIPGAKLIPLSELEQRVDEIKNLPESMRIIYCRSGNRSGRAAAALVQYLGMPNVFNLAGGISAYNGHTVDDFPRLAAFDTSGSVRDLLRQALDLEKGADRFYASLLPYFENTPVHDIVVKLSEAEEAHGLAVYKALVDAGETGLPAFEDYYANLPGELLEDGRSYDEAVKRANAMIRRNGQAALLELALEVEYRSYDLYRQLAHESSAEEHRRVFLDLAEQEKRHIKGVFRAFNNLAAN